MARHNFCETHWRSTAGGECPECREARIREMEEHVEREGVPVTVTGCTNVFHNEDDCLMARHKGLITNDQFCDVCRVVVDHITQTTEGDVPWERL